PPPPTPPLLPYTTLFRSQKPQPETLLKAGQIGVRVLVDACARGVFRKVPRQFLHLCARKAPRHHLVHGLEVVKAHRVFLRLGVEDRKSTRLNSSHVSISY